MNTQPKHGYVLILIDLFLFLAQFLLLVGPHAAAAAVTAQHVPQNIQLLHETMFNSSPKKIACDSHRSSMRGRRKPEILKLIYLNAFSRKANSQTAKLLPCRTAKLLRAPARKRS